MGVSYAIFWIDVFHPHGTQQRTAFRSRSRGVVEDFHRVAISSGGQDNGGPRLRFGDYPLGYFAAFFWIQTAATSRPSSGRANGGALN